MGIIRKNDLFKEMLNNPNNTERKYFFNKYKNLIQIFIQKANADYVKKCVKKHENSLKGL